jgi:hypothetical protein
VLGTEAWELARSPTCKDNESTHSVWLLGGVISGCGARTQSQPRPSPVLVRGPRGRGRGPPHRAYPRLVLHPRDAEGELMEENRVAWEWPGMKGREVGWGVFPPWTLYVLGGVRVINETAETEPSRAEPSERVDPRVDVLGGLRVLGLR